MTQRSKGFIRLEWTCPNCSTRNPGPQKTCTSCGAPQPANVQFERGTSNDFIKDENEIKQAAAGADIHCAYCGARNPATAATCAQCGADLKEGARRESGREMGAAGVPTVVACPSCGQSNPGTNAKCANCGASLPRAAAAAPPAPAVQQPAPAPAPGSGPIPVKPAKPISKRNIIIGAVILFLLCCCCGAFFALANTPRSTVTATVDNVYWQTSVSVQEEREVHHSNESGNPPSGAYNVDCRTETREVCTERTVDRGNGYAEVVEDCHNETDKYCSYDIMEWDTIREDRLDGYDTFPVYARPSLRAGQREGNTSITMTVYFSAPDGEREYKPSSITEFQQFDIGSTWDLSISWLGNIISVEPAQ